MGRLSTHVLDTVTGKPAVGMRVDFSVLENGAWKLLKSVRTNADGRVSFCGFAVWWLFVWLPL